jgi:hypothetical protein
MLRKILVTAALILMATNFVLAKDEKVNPQPPAAKPAAPQPTVIATQQQKDLLVANVTNMRNQELRVAVLQQLLNEEVSKLRNLQATFCDQYKLDVEKFRKGLYRYDEASGKFVETEQPVKPAATP